MVTAFKENLNLQLPLIFYSSIRFVFETVFISEQTAEIRFGALLQISVKSITKFNVFSYMILQFRLQTVEKISKPYSVTLKTVPRQFCLKGQSLYHKSTNGKIHEDKAQSPLLPAKYGGTFFIKKLCMGEQTKIFSGDLFFDVLVLFQITYLWDRLIEKKVRGIHSESEGSWLKPRLPGTLGSNEYQMQ